nr:phage integrase N-terminal SAM-like domain-containing protein [Acinetobacter ursingii]
MMTTQHPKLFDLVRQRIRYKHMSYRTEQAYCGWIKRYVIFHQMRHPQEMGRLEVESYLSHLVNVGNVSQSTHHQALSALLFLYKEVLGVGLPWLLELNRPNKPKRLPVALTHLEVQSVFKHLSGIHLLMAKMLYGTGMRLTELLQLRIKDIDLSVCLAQSAGNPMHWLCVFCRCHWGQSAGYYRRDVPRTGLGATWR